MSALDEQMALAYRHALSQQAAAADALKAGQRAWLAALQPRGTAVDVSVLKDSYRA